MSVQNLTLMTLKHKNKANHSIDIGLLTNRPGQFEKQLSNCTESIKHLITTQHINWNEKKGIITDDIPAYGKTKKLNAEPFPYNID